MGDMKFLPLLIEAATLVPTKLLVSGGLLTVIRILSNFDNIDNIVSYIMFINNS